MRARLVAALLAGALAAPPAAVAVPAPGGGGPLLIVGVRDGAGPSARAALEARAGIDLGERVTARGARVARVVEGSAERALARLAVDPAVRWAERDRTLRASLTPDDPLFRSQWGLLNAGQEVAGVRGTAGADIDAAAAWDVTTGDPRVRVAVIDGGVDHTHPDLAPNVTGVNPGESGGGREANGRDDDGNGRVDDSRGWDFVGGDADPQDDDLVSHGSVVAGVIAARGGDGAGTAGVAWRATLIPVRALGADGVGTTADLAAAITYAAERGARVINASFGGSPSTAIAEAIAGAPGALVVAAAGNGRPGSGGRDVGYDVDLSPVHPCALPLENVVCVTATDATDRLAGFANSGAASVDVAAPGVRIIGPLRGGGWGPLTGTSFAAPHAAGVAALVLAANPDASTRQLRRALLDGAEPVAALAGRVATGGRVSAAGALAAVPPPDRGPGGTTGEAADVGPTTARLTGSVPASPVPLAYRFDYGPTAALGSSTPTRAVPPGAGRAVSEAVDRLPAGAMVHQRLVVASVAGVTRGADRPFTTPGAAAPPPGAAPATAPADAGPAPRSRRAGIRRPTARVMRRGRAWYVSVRLGARATLRLVLERRRPARAGVRIRHRLVRRTVPRRLAAGTRRLPLGRLATGRYRLRVRLTGTARPVTLRRAILVPPTRRGRP